MFRGLAQWARHKIQLIEITDAHIDPTWASVEQSLTTACQSPCGHRVVLFVLYNRAKVSVGCMRIYTHMHETVSLIVEVQNVKIYKDCLVKLFTYLKQCFANFCHLNDKPFLSNRGTFSRTSTLDNIKCVVTTCQSGAGRCWYGVVLRN